MEASGVRPGPDPVPRTGIAHSSDRTRFTLAEVHTPGQP